MTILAPAALLDPEIEAVGLNLGDLYYLRRETQKGIELYKKAGENNPLAELIAARLRYKTPWLKK